ncbi:hypothetical protein SAMD00019534_007550, partial [Acytostelium subglobosum LB1]|uniref:hypothetical protein n=1 Tax=Acytostelium subglobosum LB1 TaxID=1410327 RepID=UPI0006448F17
MIRQLVRRSPLKCGSTLSGRSLTNGNSYLYCSISNTLVSTRQCNQSYLLNGTPVKQSSSSSSSSSLSMLLSSTRATTQNRNFSSWCVNNNINNNRYKQQQQQHRNEHQQQQQSEQNQFSDKQYTKMVLFSSAGLGVAALSVFQLNTNSDEKDDNDEPRKFNIKESQKVIGGIILVNVGIYMLLKSPSFLLRYGDHFFCSVNNVSSRPLCILLSNFTHTEPFHLLFNMIGLWSFGQVAHDHMGTLPFLMLYVGGGLVGSMTSIVHKLVTSSFTIPSIGASGCVLSVVGASIMFEPNNRVSIIFMPFFSFESQTMLFALLAFDLIGVLGLGKFTNWDHSCHLGSTLLGAVLGDSYRYKSTFQHFQGTGVTMNEGRWTYKGSFKNGKMEGVGSLHKLPENDLYEGLFQNGQIKDGILTRDGKRYRVS